MATDKEVLFKGIKKLAGSLPFLFMGPVVINSAFKNQGHPLYPFVLLLGILICVLAVYLLFKGVTTITKSMFDGDRNK